MRGRTGNDYAGKRFGSLIAIRFLRREKSRRIWLFQCDCGGTAETYVSGESTPISCGCRGLPFPKVGERFGRLTALGPAAERPKWLFVCDCGTEIVRHRDRVQDGRVQSCGCLLKDIARENNRRYCLRHGRRHSPLYYRWRGMILRCHNPQNPQYARYGGRGIEVCKRWRDSFENFLKDMGDPVGERRTRDLQIDRIDNDRGYEPGNCRWVTSRENQNNRGNNVRITFRGETLTQQDWARRLGWGADTIANRLRSANFTTEQALSIRPMRPSEAAKWAYAGPRPPGGHRPQTKVSGPAGNDSPQDAT
jgi:hypothetical protein